jgi:hypothetical protein
MLQLFVADTNVSSGTVAVSWCVNQEVLASLAKQGILDPQVVIITAPVDNYIPAREYRKVVPLKDLMAYVEFKTAGPNRIWAFISRFGLDSTRDHMLTRSNGIYITDLLNYNGSEYSSYTYDCYQKLLNAQPLTVVVPLGVFAKEPPAWEKAWVNHWFRGRPDDQCDYRKRRLLAYTVQPIGIFLDLLFRSIALFAASLWLSRGMTFEYILHPLRSSIPEAMQVCMGGSWAIAKLPEDDLQDHEVTFFYLFRKFWKMIFLPPVVAAVILTSYFHIWKYMGLGFAGALLLILMVVLVVSGSMVKMVDHIIERIKKSKTDKLPWYLDQEEMDIITCTPNMKSRTGIADLPANHRTIHLRFQDLKSKVCRPFAR